MVAFFSHLEDREENKELKGKLGLKTAQLEDSLAQEERFLTFISNN